MTNRNRDKEMAIKKERERETSIKRELENARVRE